MKFQIIVFLLASITNFNTLLKAQDCSEIFGTKQKQGFGLTGIIYNFKINSNPISFDFKEADILDTIYLDKLDIKCNNFTGFKFHPDKKRWFAVQYSGNFYIEDSTEFDINFALKIYGQLIIDSDTICEANKAVNLDVSLDPALGIYKSKYLNKGMHTIKATYVHTSHKGALFYLKYKENQTEKYKPFNLKDFKPFSINNTNLGITLNISDAILFSQNSTDLNQQSISILNDIYHNLIAANDSIALVIEGYTDNSGTNIYNKELSLKRAQNVAKAITSISSLKDNIWVIGHGESQPKFPNNNETNRAKNRRVEILISNRPTEAKQYYIEHNME